MAVFTTERGGPEFFLFCPRGDQHFFLFVRGGTSFFYRGQRGGPGKIGDSSSQIDGPPILVKNDTSLTIIWNVANTSNVLAGNQSSVSHYCAFPLIKERQCMQNDFSPKFNKNRYFSVLLPYPSKELISEK